jgi:hypothetical protein
MRLLFGLFYERLDNEGFKYVFTQDQPIVDKPVEKQKKEKINISNISPKKLWGFAIRPFRIS